MISVMANDEWNGVYTIWFLSFVLTQYLNLFVGEFVIPSGFEPNEYTRLTAKKRMIFQSMTNSM